MLCRVATAKAAAPDQSQSCMQHLRPRRRTEAQQWQPTCTCSLPFSLILYTLIASSVLLLSSIPCSSRLPSFNMPVTIIPAAHEPKSHPTMRPADSIKQLLQRSCPDSHLPNKTRVVASSFRNLGTGGSDAVYPSSSSFVRSAIEAWGRHSHLVLRPEDLWFTILVQINFFMQENAESVRHLFVSHAGKKPLTVWANSWPEVVEGFRAELQKNIKTPWMSDWVSPGFSTSDEGDEQTATVLMMGLMKAFFEFEGGIVCGIPSITLLGTKQDWQRLLKKIDRIEEFGVQPKDYARRLRPILSRIVSTFDSPASAETKDFWNQLVHAKVMHSEICGAPPVQYYVSGWILGFFYWTSEGYADCNLSSGSRSEGALKYDGVKYGMAALEDLPMGYAKAKFKMLNEHGGEEETFKGWVLAGSVGKSIVDGAPRGYQVAVAHRDYQESSGEASDEDEACNCLSGLMCSLGCFGRSSAAGTSAGNVRSSSEKQATMENEKGVELSRAHSTIQPRSGWFLFGPDTDAGPFHDDEEICGPTVDAINSCEGVEHVHDEY